uniref:Uncharacterized protein n=1 Tax=Anguilla anguilla TaxID=7936 RepID=A0A0E9WYB3_ANGAN
MKTVATVSSYIQQYCIDHFECNQNTELRNVVFSSRAVNAGPGEANMKDLNACVL